MRKIIKIIKIILIGFLIYALGNIIFDEDPRMIFYIILLSLEAIALIGQYVINKKKLYKMYTQKLEESIDMGEGLLSFCGTIYIPSIYLLFSAEWMRCENKILISGALTGIILFLSIQIYEYKKQLRNRKIK